MGYNRQDVERLLKALRYDLTAVQGKLTELTKALAALAPSLPDAENAKPYVCHLCGLGFGQADQHSDHLANVHGYTADPGRPL